MGLLDRFRRNSKAWSKTIVAFEPPYQLQELGTRGQPQGEADVVSADSDKDLFKIRLAHSRDRATEASFLVQKRYTDVGYLPQAGSQPVKICPEQITLLSYHNDKVVGTLTLGLDIGQGLYADELYKPELDKLRSDGRKLAEITKLAVDTKLASKRILAALIHIAYIYGRKLWRYTDLVIEVNPNHAKFYQRMLGFTMLGEARMCQRVNAPAVLLWVEGEFLDKKIAEFGGTATMNMSEKTFYPYFFSLAEERSITHDLLEREKETHASSS